MTAHPQFPPLLTGLAVAGLDPFEQACHEAARGVDAGLVLYDIRPDLLRAAIVLAPEVPLAKAMAMLPVCQIGLQNALGVLAPPEVAVHLDWSGAVRVNGAVCGGFRVAANQNDPAEQPDWMVLGFDLILFHTIDDPGKTPDVTSLYNEGCADILPGDLLESWARHTLNWIARWEEEGPQPVHREWAGLLYGLGEPIRQNGETGTFLGLDENFGMLLRSEGGTGLIPLTRLLGERE